MSRNITRTGILGGTFNPIHLGHLIFAQSAAEQLMLDRVVFIPAGNPPHKQNMKGIVSNEHRLEMVKLSIDSNPDFEVDTYEIEKNGFSYSFETLEELKKRNPDDDLYFCIGQDALLKFESWKCPEKISSLAHIVTTARPGSEEMEQLTRTAERLSGKFGGDFIVIDSPLIEISSTEIRKRAAAMQSFRYLVTDEVFDYILKNHLYMEPEE